MKAETAPIPRKTWDSAPPLKNPARGAGPLDPVIICGDIDVKERNGLERGMPLQDIPPAEKFHADAAGKKNAYPIEMEHRLVRLILLCDADAVCRLAEQIFSHIALSEGDVTRGKARCFELMTIISRAVIDAGADIESILSLNGRYLENLSKRLSHDELRLLFSSSLDMYVSYLRKTTSGRYSYPISCAVSFIRQNYAARITLEETAKSVYLSRSYFSTLFTKETGISFKNYVTRIRIEKSRLMLLDRTVKLADVGSMVGFADQSHFTKCFREIEGISPGKYRNIYCKAPKKEADLPPGA
jgi:AraC-like DNA-binding protein